MKIISSINFAHNIAKLNQQIYDLENSNLSNEEKIRALKSFKKMMITTTIVVTIITLFIVIAMFIVLSINETVAAIFLIISLITFIIISLFYVIIARRIFKDWVTLYNKVYNGFDGLTEQEINKLKPNADDKILIKKYRKKSLIYGGVCLLSLALEFYIIIALNVFINSFIFVLVTTIIITVWGFFEYNCSTERHRLKTGYYKRNFGYVCMKCKNEVFIEFDKIEIYKDAPRNENGIRVILCPKCKNSVPLYDLDIKYNDYKKYIEQTK